MQFAAVFALLLVAIVAQVSAFVGAPAQFAQRITRRNLFGSEPPKNTPAKADQGGGGGMFGGEMQFKSGDKLSTPQCSVA
jgi:hypothetical protein